MERGHDEWSAGVMNGARASLPALSAKRECFLSVNSCAVHNLGDDRFGYAA